MTHGARQTGRRGTASLRTAGVLLWLSVVIAGGVVLLVVLRDRDPVLPGIDGPAPPAPWREPSRAPSHPAPHPDDPPARPPEGALSVAGLVRDEAGRPVEGARVVLGPEDQRRPGAPWLDPVSTVLDGAEAGRYLSYPSVTTGPSGRYAFEGAARGRRTLLAVHPSFRHFLEPLEVTESLTRDIVLLKGLSLAGRVEDTGGRGVPGVEVAVFQSLERAGRTFQASKRTRSDEQGAWRVDGFAPGAVKAAAVLRPGSEMLLQGEKIREATAGAGPVVFRVLRLGLVEFSARLVQDDAPLVAGVRARPMNATAPLAAFRVVPARGGAGRFLLRAPPGDWLVRLDARGVGSAQLSVHVRPGETVRLEDTVYFGGVHALEGVVRAADGKPCPGAFVYAERRDDPLGFTAGVEAGRDGGFRLEGLKAGAYRLVAFARGRGMAVVDAAVSRNATRDLTLAPLPAEPAPQPFTFGQRKGVAIDYLSVQEVDLPTALSWVSAVFQVNLRASPGLMQAHARQKRTVTVTLLTVTVEEAVAVLERVLGARFHRDSGVFEEKP